MPSLATFLSLSAGAPVLFQFAAPVPAFTFEPTNPAMSDLIHMKNNRKTSAAELAKGQV
jgi:hypothetical protein